jgi:urea transport system permease protein
MGGDYIVEAFMVVILGGMGQLSGAVAGGAVIGTGDSFLAKILSAPWLEKLAVWLGVRPENWERIIGTNTEVIAKVLVLLMVIGFILIRPSGLFASRERTYD